jgi:LruC domain-containing protein
LAFEDNWPGKGDYDFNDIVIDYNFRIVTDASDHISEIFGSFVLKASGAYFNNAFGFEITGVVPETVSSVDGTFVDEVFTIDDNGTESAQEWATIILFDNAFEHLEYPGSGIGVNTDPEAVYVEPVAFNITIQFKEDGQFPSGGPVDFGTLNESTFNPFIVADQERGKEIHLPDYTPTSLADEGYFGSGDDDSNPGVERYYKTTNNLPWAINIVESFDYPIEKIEILDAYLKFAPWAESNGEEYEDWYEDQPGYRVNENIYQVP